MMSTWKRSLLALIAAAGAAAADPPSPSTDKAVLPVADAKKEADSTQTKACLDECTTLCGPRVWASSDYLWWRIKDAPIPEPLLLANSTPGGIPLPGFPGTQVAYGQQDQTLGGFSGGRLTLGGWLNESRTMGLEGSAFLLEERSAGISAASDPNGNPALGAPLNIGIPGPPFLSAALPLSFPSLLNGSSTIVSTTQLWGAEANIVGNLRRTDRIDLRALVGFRHLSLEEDLSVTRAVNVIGVDLGASANNFFGTQNRFYGGQFGGQARVNFGRFYVDGLMKVALGSTIESVTLAGASSIHFNGQSFPLGESPMVRASNAGTTRNARFAVVPEVTGKLGFRLTDNISAYAGYTFIYWNDVARPGEQVDTRLSLPTGPFPARTGATTDLFVHGLTFGGEVRF
jgi:hypothetical protein